MPARPGILSSEFFQIIAKGNGVLNFSIASEIKGEYNVKGKGKWPCEENYYLDRRVFIPFVLEAGNIKSDAPFVFSYAKKSLLVRNGKRKARFDGQPPLKGYGFEDNERDKKIKSRLELTAHARFLIHCALNCAANDHATPQLKCVYVQPVGKVVNIYATNRTILYQAKSKDQIKPPIPIPFPLFLVGLLEEEAITEVQWRETYVALVFPQGQIWQSVSSSARKKFPHSSIDFYIKKSHKAPDLFDIPTKKFAQVISRLGIYLGAVRRQDWLLTIEGERGAKELTLTSVVPQTTFHEKLALESALKTSFKMNWPLDMLLPVFEFMKTKDKGNMQVRLLKDCAYVNTTDVNLVIPGKE